MFENLFGTTIPVKKQATGMFANLFSTPTSTHTLTPTSPTPTKIMPAFLGGGEFNATPNTLTTSTRGYPMQSETDQWREHIIPVSLGGTSSGDNVKLYGEEKGKEKTAYENEQIRLYKAGKIDLPEARANVLNKYRELTGLSPTPKEQTTKGQLLPAIKELPSTIGGFFKNLFSPVVDKAKNIFTSKDKQAFQIGENMTPEQQQIAKQTVTKVPEFQFGKALISTPFGSKEAPTEKAIQAQMAYVQKQHPEYTPDQQRAKAAQLASSLGVAEMQAIGMTEPMKEAGGVLAKNLLPKAAVRIEESLPKIETKLGTEKKLISEAEQAIESKLVKTEDLLPAEKSMKALDDGKSLNLKTETPATKLKSIESELSASKPALVDNTGNALDTSYSKVIRDMATPIEKKITVLDYLRTPDKVLVKIGMENEAKVLRTQYEKYIKELPQEIEKVTNWAKQTTPSENVEIFKFLDGQKVELSEKTQKIANEIKSYLKEWANKLKLPEEHRISNYITHIFDEELIQKEFPDELARIIQDKVAGSVYDPFTLKRLGVKGYVEDTWQALDAYVKRGVRKYNLDPALEKIKKASKNLEVSQFNYVKSFIDRVNMRPTEIDILIDNFIKSSPIGYKLGQRPVAKLSKAGRQMIFRGGLGLNISSALRNLSQGANTFAKLGTRWTTSGYIDMVKHWNGKELEDVGVLADNFIEDRVLSSSKKFLEKLDKGLFYLFDRAEKINRGAAYYGAKNKALAAGKTLSEAIESGKKMVRDTQFVFGKIDTPVALQSDLVKVVTQFQTFTIKQIEFLTEMAKNKEFAGLIRYIGSTLLFIGAIGKSFGMSPKDMIPTYRFGSPPALKPILETGKALLNTPDKYGKTRDMGEKTSDIFKSLVPFVPAGGQIKKTIGGLNTYSQGGQKNVKGKYQYEVSKNKKNLLKSAVFGKYATPEAIEYYSKFR